MAITDPYATEAEYRLAAGKDDTSENVEITTDLTAISRYMERKSGTFWTKDAAAVARVFMPRSTGIPTRPDWAESENPWKYGGLSRTLYFDAPLVSVTTIKIDEDKDGVFSDETALAATDYELLPRNAALGPEPAPYTAMELTQWGAKNAFTPGARVEVTGIWGWPAVPERVKRACIHLTAILRLETPRATRTLNELGQILDTNQKAASIIDDLIRMDKRIAL
jgi:hypothetical protein